MCILVVISRLPNQVHRNKQVHDRVYRHRLDKSKKNENDELFEHRIENLLHTNPYVLDFEVFQYHQPYFPNV
jgi:hypothetical protein